MAGEKRLAAALGPLDTVITKKIIKTLSVTEAPSRGDGAVYEWGHNERRSTKRYLQNGNGTYVWRTR
jgi:hypothetical protein